MAEDNGTIVGLLDIEPNGDSATIDSIAVHPSARQQGIATALLAEALPRLPFGTRTLDTWTREDAAANGWYQGNCFEEAYRYYRYLHVYKGDKDPNEGFQGP
ncbi:GNAT family N-acetyltransferase [Arthrobacter sp. AQ5-05]|uniref:GNAT family N-acetyltransferase n=1 Tax=Arthrobacter sp. AQ5-05 TaxID=2184581 RepID=UPI0025707289|nr:GNAT family N-acetyltransferase [Arthrobacter sp. AQ5-05]